ncbi:hypothetical protein, partial [Paraburkholderia sp. EG304]|uniref:hypothetical protein n=1 Tax=Paraburkholderia sp. EG304 TaxID=3237015 RepID=UPI003978D377
IAPRPFAVPLETRTFVSFHRQRLLLHPVLPSLSTPLYNAPSSALDPFDILPFWLSPHTPVDDVALIEGC